ncbi:hypothetical protein A5893_02665 [Pedobacter psychrophilus]|uniref:Carbohydrate-binding protein SusD n=1 Tax=Pedobacter psychrophilus TaxID=1826909 RepID=A0A179DLV9_9SPHI|nr:RagB/SusD family nutrient uptake outer membrane protein [Pedobacter psychrophilus]OAQ42035.1 hypothetical protein A5893_02665 [Pedobacter psychrophilus]
MKNIRYNLNFSVGALILLTLGMSSCKKILDVEPTTQYALGNYFQSTKQADAALLGAYHQLQIATNQEFIYYGEGRADNVIRGAGSITSNTLGVLNNTLDGNLSYAQWDSYYSVIKQANLILKNVPLMRTKGILIADADYNRILGQAYGLRALCYLNIVKIWGDAPLVTQPIEDVKDINDLKTPRVDKQLIYNLISADLKKAVPLTPTTNATNDLTRGKLTKAAIYSIQTDYYMWRNMPDSALISSGLIIKPADGTPVSSTYSLVELYNATANYSFANTSIDDSPYSKMFVDGLSTESIFEVVFSFDEENTSNIFGIYGNNNAQFYANSEFSSSFGNDLRGIANFKNDVQIYKQFPKGTFDQTTQNDKNVILYRLADIMLLRAEALNTKGDRNGAWTLIKKIRERAYGPVEVQTTIPNPNPALPPTFVINNPNTRNSISSGPTSETAKASFFAASLNEAEDIILNERRKELAFEGKRWFDLVRTGRVFTTINPTTLKPLVVNAENILWPIGLDVIRQNTNIIQNEYYK